MAINENQEAIKIMTEIFNTARNGTLSDQNFLIILSRLLDANNQTLANELANTWNDGKKKKG